MVDPRNYVDFARDVLQFPEAASRIAELRLVARDLGWSPGMPLDLATANALINAAKQVTTDFTGAGNVGRVMNQAMPFFNAQIQGPRAHVRAIQRNPKKFFARGIEGTIAALAVWFSYKDEDWWVEMPESLKYGFTYIPFTGKDGTRELLRIPRSFEADGLFMAGAQALADAWYQREPEHASAWFKQWLGGSVPSLPPIMEDTAEQLANRDFYFDRPIVPRNEEQDFPAEQYNSYTSNLSIKLGEITGVSPRRIDHSIRSYFGGVGGDVATIFGQGGKEAETSLGGDTLKDIPVLGTLFTRSGASPKDSRSIDVLYEHIDYTTKVQRSGKAKETAKQRNARLMLNDAAQAVTYASATLNATTDRKQRQEIMSERARIARDAVKAFESDEAARAKFTAWKSKWDRLSKQAERRFKAK